MSEPQWGGPREGAGRPPEHEQPRRQLIIRATDEEMEQIKQLGTRERAEILLRAIKK